MHPQAQVDEPPMEHTILIVEDDQQIVRLLQTILGMEGFAVMVANTGAEAVECALREVPHLVLLDVLLPPGLDGFEVVRRLRGNIKTAHIPVVILSAKNDTADKVRAFETAVDDYLTKPFNTDELLARIRTQLRHVQQNLLSPLTGLPGGLQVERAIGQKLRETEPWAILYLDLDHFKAYNDVYGFLRGNDLIRLTGRVALEVVRERGSLTDFVAHIGGDDFVIFTTPDEIEPLCQELIRRFEGESRALYSEDDLRRGGLLARDRQGQEQRYPLVSLSIGVVTNQFHPLTNMEEVSRTAAEVKHKAKEMPGSSYFVDRRGAPHDGNAS